MGFTMNNKRVNNLSFDFLVVGNSCWTAEWFTVSWAGCKLLDVHITTDSYNTYNAMAGYISSKQEIRAIVPESKHLSFCSCGAKSL